MSSSSFKRALQHPQHQLQEEKPWLKYPDSNGQSRLFSPVSPHKYPGGTSTSTSVSASDQSSPSSQPLSQQPRAPHAVQGHGLNQTHASRSETGPVGPGLHHKRSSSKLHSSNASNSSSASLSMSLAGSNSSSDSLGGPAPHHHNHHHSHSSTRVHRPTSFSSTKPRTLSEELSFSLLSDNGNVDTSINNINSSSNSSSRTTVYPSPITPSDLLGIPDLPSSSASKPKSSSSLSSTASTTSVSVESPLQRTDSSSHKLRPSPLSINTTFNNTTSNTGNGAVNGTSFIHRPLESPKSARGGSTTTLSEGSGSPRANPAIASSISTFSAGPRTPRLTHSSSHSSSASNSSYSNASSPSSTTPPCSALCHHHHHSSKGHPSSSHPSHSHNLQHQHHSGCHHKQDRHHSRHHHHSHNHHHPSCQYHAPTATSRRHGSRSDRTANKSSHRKGAPQFVPEHGLEDEDMSTLLTSPLAEDTTALDMMMDQDVGPVIVTSTAVTIVGSTPEFGMGQLRQQDDVLDQDMNDGSALNVYSTTEPPKKRQRSTAGMLLGAAVETVIFTSAVALSAYQLLTGKGKRQLLDATMTPVTDETMNTAETAVPEVTEKAMVQIKSAPVNIPSRGLRHRSSNGHLLGKSLHHNQHYHPSSSSHHHSNKSKHASSNKHSSSHKSRHGHGHGLSTSLPHAYGQDGLDDHMKGVVMPERPNTGTEDNDEQFLRMEAQLTSLIAEGKRALNSRIPDWSEA